MAKPSDKELKEMAKAKSMHVTIEGKIEALEQIMQSVITNNHKNAKSIEQIEIDLGIIKANLQAPAEDNSNDEDVQFWEGLIKDVDRLKSKMGM